MAGKATKRTVKEFSPLVNQIDSEASFQTFGGEYATRNGKRETVRPAKSEMRPYTYFQLNPMRIDNKTKLVNAIGDLLDQEKCNLPLTTLIGDINYGLDQRTRSDMRQGLDSELTQNQRDAIKKLVPLVQDGVLDREVAVSGLERLGMTDEQIERSLSIVQEDN